MESLLPGALKICQKATPLIVYYKGTFHMGLVSNKDVAEF